MPVTASRVSIVLPTFNGSRHLAESIESCLRQTYPHWELILVDDGSTDRTPELIATYCARDARIRSLRHPANRRLPAALNTGFAQASGDYLTWTSDDNRFQPQALARMVALLDSQPAVGVVYCDFTKIGEDGEVGGHVVVPEPKRMMYTSCIGPCFLYRAAVHKVVGEYSEASFLAEDYDFWLRAAEQFHFAALHEPLYVYRSRRWSLSGQHARKASRIAEALAAEHVPRFEWVNRRDRAHALYRLACRAGRRREWSAAMRRLVSAARQSPARVLSDAARTLARTVQRNLSARLQKPNLFP